MKIIVQSVLAACAAGLGLLVLYSFVMMLGSGSWEYTISELFRLRYWVGALVLGFSANIGLFVYVRECQKVTGAQTTATGTNAVISASAMLVCCAHHITDIVPFIGISVATAFLARFQEWFLAIGVLSNIVGLLLMARHLPKLRL